MLHFFIAIKYTEKTSIIFVDKQRKEPLKKMAISSSHEQILSCYLQIQYKKQNTMLSQFWCYIISVCCECEDHGALLPLNELSVDEALKRKVNINQCNDTEDLKKEQLRLANKYSSKSHKYNYRQCETPMFFYCQFYFILPFPVLDFLPNFQKLSV